MNGYPIFDRLPEGTRAVAVKNDDSWPILRTGDFVVIDPSQRDPEHGELYLMQYDRRYGETVQTIAQLNSRWMEWANKPAGFGWWAAAFNRPRTKEQVIAMAQAGHIMRGADGPYDSEGEGYQYLKNKVIGKVVGVFQSDFDETKLIKVN